MPDALPVLYSFRRCPYAMRARLALAASGLAYEHREVVLRNKPAALLVASPKGTVPVLVLKDGTVIEQSLEIMQWALTQNDPAHWLSPLQPPGPATTHRMQTLIAANDEAFKRHLDRYKYPHRHANEWTSTAKDFSHMHRSSAAAWLLQLEPMLEDGWLSGPSASWADMAILPFVRQFARVDPPWFASQPWPQLRNWLEAFEASAIFQSVMQKHPTWQAESDLLSIV